MWKEPKLGRGNRLAVFSGTRTGSGFSGRSRENSGRRKDSVQLDSGGRNSNAADADCVLGARVQAADSELRVVAGVNLKRFKKIF